MEYTLRCPYIPSILLLNPWDFLFGPPSFSTGCGSDSRALIEILSEDIKVPGKVYIQRTGEQNPKP